MNLKFEFNILNWTISKQEIRIYKFIPQATKSNHSYPTFKNRKLIARRQTTAVKRTDKKKKKKKERKKEELNHRPIFDQFFSPIGKYRNRNIYRL